MRDLQERGLIIARSLSFTTIRLLPVHSFVLPQCTCRNRRTAELAAYNAELKSRGEEEVAELPRKAYVSYGQISDRYVDENLKMKRLIQRAEEVAKATGYHGTAMMDLGSDYWKSEGLLPPPTNEGGANAAERPPGPTASSGEVTRGSSTGALGAPLEFCAPNNLPASFRADLRDNYREAGVGASRAGPAAAAKDCDNIDAQQSRASSSARDCSDGATACATAASTSASSETAAAAGSWSSSVPTTTDAAVPVSSAVVAPLAPTTTPHKPSQPKPVDREAEARAAAVAESLRRFQRQLDMERGQLASHSDDTGASSASGRDASPRVHVAWSGPMDTVLAKFVQQSGFDFEKVAKGMKAAGEWSTRVLLSCVCW